MQQDDCLCSKPQYSFLERCGLSCQGTKCTSKKQYAELAPAVYCLLGNALHVTAMHCIRTTIKLCTTVNYAQGNEEMDEYLYNAPRSGGFAQCVAFVCVRGEGNPQVSIDIVRVHLHQPPSLIAS